MQPVHTFLALELLSTRDNEAEMEAHSIFEDKAEIIEGEILHILGAVH